jgi:cytochrome c oxidase subunit 2
MGKLFGILLTAITLASAAIFAAHIWWMPANISAQGAAVDRLMGDTLAGTGLLFLTAQLLLAVFAWQFGEHRNGTASNFPGGSKPLIAFALLVVGIEIAAFTFLGSKVWASVYMRPAETGEPAIDVQAEQFAFYFRYAGPDGKFGALHPAQISETNNNFFGLDLENDPAARDDIVTGALAVPVNRPVLLTLHPQDVGHSFYVPELRIQQDFLPGAIVPVRFTAVRTGRYEIVCTQLCGLGHYNMKAYLDVMQPDQFDAWLKANQAK